MKWMKLAGIIGIVVVISSLILSILTFFDKESLFILTIFNLVLLILFYWGFVKMGEYTKSKLLKISSWLVIISSILLIVLTIGLVFLKSSIDQIAGILIGIVVFLPITWGILVFSLLLSIGLITIGDKIKFAKIAGILGIVLFVLNGIGSFVGDFVNNVSFLTSIQLIFKGVVLFFMSLSLFDASKKFEK